MPSYAAITPATIAQIVSASGANSQEQKWAAQMAVGAAAKNIYARLIGGVASGKPIKQIVDTQKVQGTTIHLSVRAPLGGAGTAGTATDITGNGESRKFTTYSTTIGSLWHGVKHNNIAKAQTLLGSITDQANQGDLKTWWANRQGWDINAEFHARTHARNTVFAGNKASIEALRGGDTFQPATSRQASDVLSSIQGVPINLARKGHQEVRRFFLQGNNRLFADMETSNEWQNLLSNTDIRGDSNALFTGLLPSWGGCIWDRHELTFDTADGPQGNFDVPVAFSGSAITSALVDDTGSATIDLLGGGSAAAGALTDRQYFWHFPNGPYAAHEGTKIQASTAAAKYALVRVLSGSNAGKFGMIKYTTNNGNKLVVQAVLSNTTTSGATANQTVGNVTYNSGIWTSSLVTDDFPIGSEIIPCNSYGQPYVHGIVLAQDAMVTGYGSMDGQVCMFRRSVVMQNHDRDAEMGAWCIWGSRAMENANNMVNGYVVVTAAYNPPGFPGVS